MVQEAVSIKGTQDGLTIQVSENAALSDMLTSLQQKLIDAKGYFDNTKLKLNFSGKKLSNIEMHELLEIIRKNSKMEIVSVSDQTAESISSKSYARITQDDVKLKTKIVELTTILEEAQKKAAFFHNGTLRSGQSIVSDEAVIILGDVKNGAVVNAGGSVIILGKLKGVVNAGLKGKKNSFIFALEMDPTLLQISGVYGRFGENQGVDLEPMVAYVHLEQIAIEPISNSINKDLEI